MDIIIITHDLELAYPVRDSLAPLESDILVCPNYPSFSKVVNEAICKATNEIVIICSYKARPTPSDVQRLLSLLDEGYGFVGLYRFGFFGFRKDLIHRIGFMDERFLGGGYEDNDFMQRVIEADIAYYDAENIQFIQRPSSWTQRPPNWSCQSGDSYTKLFFEKKWVLTDTTIQRCIDEEKYNYNLNCKVTDVVYKKRTESISLCSKITNNNFCRNIIFLPPKIDKEMS